MPVTAQQVKELRNSTGAGIGDCKQALMASDGDFEKAADWLRLKIGSRVSAPRITVEGIVDSYIHMGGKIGVLVEVNCETDFAAHSSPFKALVRDISLQIAASNPLYVSSTDVDPAHLAKEKEIIKAQLADQKKPEAIMEKIVTGKVAKFYGEVCLTEQAFVKNPDMKVQQVIDAASKTLGETIRVRRFSRFVMGEGLSGVKTDFAAAVRMAITGESIEPCKK